MDLVTQFEAWIIATNHGTSSKIGEDSCFLGKAADLSWVAGRLAGL
jgi:hypothetical protein